MLPTSSPEHDTIIIEADTVEDALEKVTKSIGLDAEILNAELVATGGIAGFFAREAVRITARPVRRGVDLLPSPPDLPTLPARTRSKTGVDAALELLVNSAERENLTFQEALSRHLGPAEEMANDKADTAPLLDPMAPRMNEGSAVLAPGQPSVPHLAQRQALSDSTWVEHAGMSVEERRQAPSPRTAYLQGDSKPLPSHAAPLGASEPGTGRVRWAVSGLTRLGLPTQVVESVVGLDPSDDMAWVAAIARSVTPFMRPLPHGSSVIVGPRAHRLGWTLDLPIFKPPERPPHRGTFIGSVNGDAESLAWLERVRGDRWLHIAVDDEPWRGLVTDDPIAVSWTSTGGVAAALALASTTGAVLGYGVGSAIGAPAVRANPLDVAIAVRTLMERD